MTVLHFSDQPRPQGLSQLARHYEEDPGDEVVFWLSLATPIFE
jgi:hypothetical protein